MTHHQFSKQIRYEFKGKKCATKYDLQKFLSDGLGVDLSL